MRSNLKFLYRKTLEEATQEQILDVLMIAKYLERIGDHATNIAEWAEYAITGVHRNSEMEEHL